MSRNTYKVKETYVGTGSKSDYTFAFKAEEVTQLQVIKYDTSNNKIFDVRGDDVTYLSSVVYRDNPDEGGTVNLIANLELNYTLVILLANDSPTQPYELREKFQFSKRAIENAIDFVAGAVMRLAYLAKRSLKLDDIDDPNVFNMILPAGIAAYAGKFLGVNVGGTGWTFYDGPSSGSGFGVEVSHAITDGQAATDLTGETIDSAVGTSQVYMYEIIRGTTVFSMGFLSLHYRNSTWYVVPWANNRDSGSVPHGVTFSQNTVGGVAQLRAACSSGPGAGTIKLKRVYFGL